MQFVNLIVDTLKAVTSFVCDGAATITGKATVGSLEVQGATTQTGLQTFAVMPAIPTATVAAVGNSQATAAAITTGFTTVTAADGTKAIVLPTAAAGRVCIVKNIAAQILKTYPGASDKINGAAANAVFNVPASTAVILVAYDDTDWYSLPLLPS